MSARVLLGDALKVLPELRARGLSFALAYLDPPFNSGRDYRTKAGEFAFSDRWPTPGAFRGCVVELARAAWELVVPGGSLVLHTDPRESPHLRVALDDRFGPGSFASEIVWSYRRWPVKQRNFQKTHDVLLRWVKPGAEPVWNQLYGPLSESTLRVWGPNRKQKAVVEAGTRKRSVLTDEPSLGAPLGDVWDFSIVPPNSPERTGYPTQKPLALLERLVLALTRPGDAVLDPCCGSGTTLVAAARNGRLACGVDQSAVAVRIARERLRGLRA